MMGLATYLLKQLPDGMTYRDAAQLCQRLSTNHSGVPENISPSTSVELADVFVELTKAGWVRDQDSPFKAFYGAHYHEITDRGHWIEVMACVFKHPEKADFTRGDNLARLAGFV
jgi:hypothetical protein